MGWQLAVPVYGLYYILLPVCLTTPHTPSSVRAHIVMISVAPQSTAIERDGVLQRISLKTTELLDAFDKAYGAHTEDGTSMEERLVRGSVCMHGYVVVCTQIISLTEVSWPFEHWRWSYTFEVKLGSS